ncbi:TlyA family RNA methyltransferase [Anaerolineales bacterium HSG25]|nr:TlyA family RNA methyltransferase [Anaerolineales bacterium HSG25]
MKKSRLDVLLVEKGLVETSSHAQALIMAGKVRVGEQVVTKAGMAVAIDRPITVEQPLPYVSRGGLKLAGALDRFEINPQDLCCADVGASTGGFTDVLLQRQARRVYAIDVGYGQLAWKLRQDERVTVMERTNARHVSTLPEPIDLVVIDASFISLRLILPAVKKWLHQSAQVIALIKPQFEAGKKQVGKGGIVRQRHVHEQVLQEVAEYAHQQEFVITGLMVSPITGMTGNYEFLIHLGWHTSQTNINLNQTIEHCLNKIGPLYGTQQ